MGEYPENWGGKSVGTIFRETREARGISLEEAAKITRISKNYLAALESDHYDKLPNPAYIKGFIRIYAGFLGLSGDQLISLYEAETGKQVAPPEKVKPETPQREPEAPQKKGRWLISLLLLILVLVASFFFQEKEERPKKPEPQPAVQPQPSVPQPLQPVVSSAKSPIPPATPPVAGQPAEKSPEPTVKQQAKGMILRLKVNQDSLLTITIDSSLSQQYDLKAGDLIEWKGERKFTLDLSNGGGVEAELNGKALAPFAAQGKPAHVVLKGDEEQKSP